MLFDDLVHIFLIDIGIPDPFGIDDYYWSFHGKRIIALTAGAAVFTQIGTEKDVIAIVGHAVTIPENTGGVKNP
jgi:hypothetical protein